MEKNCILKRVFWNIGSAWRDLQSGPQWVSTETRGGGAGLETVSSPQETRHWSQERHSGLTINHRSRYTENYVVVMNDTLSQCRRLPSLLWHPYIPHLQFLRNDFFTCYTGNYIVHRFHAVGRVRKCICHLLHSGSLTYYRVYANYTMPY